MRLNPSALKHEDGVISIDADVAKKRATRHVKMEDALRAWLAVCPPFESDKIVCAGFAKKFAALRKKAGILTNWPDNGLRHSFASYHLAKFGDAIKTAEQMGNTAEIVHKHYKALVRKSDVERFWALRPEKVIVPIVPDLALVEVESNRVCAV